MCTEKKITFFLNKSVRTVFICARPSSNKSSQALNSLGFLSYLTAFKRRMTTFFAISLPTSEPDPSADNVDGRVFKSREEALKVIHPEFRHRKKTCISFKF
jgi:hypothetical protein